MIYARLSEAGHPWNLTIIVFLKNDTLISIFFYWFLHHITPEKMNLTKHLRAGIRGTDGEKRKLVFFRIFRRFRKAEPMTEQYGAGC